MVPDLGQMSDEMSAELSPTTSPSPNPEATMSKGSSTTNRDPSQVQNRKTARFSEEARGRRGFRQCGSSQAVSSETCQQKTPITDAQQGG